MYKMTSTENKKPTYDPARSESTEHRRINPGFCPQEPCNPVMEMECKQIVYFGKHGGSQVVGATLREKIIFRREEINKGLFQGDVRVYL